MVRCRHPGRGRFITFEGGEGTGKSTQIRLLEKALNELGIDTLVTREPGGSPGAEAVRIVLLSGAAEPLGPEMEAILFAAARSDHVETVIRPALRAGKTVLCDRFFDSTRVYQGATGNVDRTFLRRLEEVACEDCWPDLTIILDLDPADGHAARCLDRRSMATVPTASRRRRWPSSAAPRSISGDRTGRAGALRGDRRFRHAAASPRKGPCHGAVHAFGRTVRRAEPRKRRKAKA